jgi:hypothetical protein
MEHATLKDAGDDFRDTTPKNKASQKYAGCDKQADIYRNSNQKDAAHKNDDGR